MCRRERGRGIEERAWAAAANPPRISQCGRLWGMTSQMRPFRGRRSRSGDRYCGRGHETAEGYVACVDKASSVKGRGRGSGTCCRELCGTTKGEDALRARSRGKGRVSWGCHHDQGHKTAAGVVGSMYVAVWDDHNGCCCGCGRARWL